MKFKKLNAAGFSHDLLLVGFVVIFAIGGVAYLVASHADSCSQPVSGAVSSAVSDAVSSPVSDAVSGSSCQPVSGAVSSAVSAPSNSPSPSPLTYTASCVLTGVPDSIAAGTVVTPTITITNSGTGAIVPAMISYAGISNGPTTYFQNITFTTINPGQSASQKLNGYSLPASQAKTSAQIFSHSDLNNAGTKASFACSKSLTITPTTVATPAPVAPPKPTPPSVTAPTIVEAETMIGHPDNYNLPDSQASGGRYRALYHTGYLARTFATAGNLHRLTIRAKGSQCVGAPQMVAYIDGKVVLSSLVSATGWTNYSAAISVGPQSHQLLIKFPNDRYTKTCDRNLYVDVSSLQP